MKNACLPVRLTLPVSTVLCAALLLLIALMPTQGTAADNLTGPYARQVQQMYVAYYGRPGDPAGVEYWAGRLAPVGGNWIADLVNAFGNSAEYTERFGELPDEALIDNLYQQLFNRTAEPVGRGFYIDLLGGTNQSGLNPSLRQSTLAQIALDIANGALNEDLTTLQNKLAVAEYFTQAVATTGRRYQRMDIGAAADILAVVGVNPSSITQARAAVDVFIAADAPEPVAEVLAVYLEGADEDNTYHLFSGESLATGPAQVALSEGQRLGLSYRLLNDTSPGLSIDTQSGALRYQPPAPLTPGAYPFTFRVTHGNQALEFDGSLNIAVVQTQDRAVADGQSPLAVGTHVRVSGPPLPAGTAVSVQTGRTDLGEPRIVVELPAQLPEGSVVEIELGELDTALPQAVPLGAAPSAASDVNEDCTDFAPYAWREEQRWFFLGLMRRSNFLTEDIAEQRVSIPAWVINPTLAAGQTAATEISFVKRRASVLCADYPQGAAQLTSDAEPVLFVHGYTLFSGLGGGSGTYEELDTHLADAMPADTAILPFELRWVTNARFEDVAADLHEAVALIREKTGKAVHIVAHSFGGLLARTYLQGLAEPATTGAPPVASLTTVGTPHSGIFGFANDQHPRGADANVLGDFAISFCAQISCFQAGQSAALREADQAALEWITGTTSQGDLIDDLGSSTHPFLNAGLPVQVLIGLRTRFDDYIDWSGLIPRWAERLVFTDGDGLISFDGQRFGPSDRKSVSLRGNQDASGARVTEHVIAVNGSYPNLDDLEVDVVAPAFPGFGHTSLYTAEDFFDLRALRAEVNVDDASHEVLPYLVDWITDNSSSSEASYNWHMGEWGICSGPCGTDEAKQTRPVFCQSNAGNTVADSFCSQVQPPTERRCTSTSCTEDENAAYFCTNRGSIYAWNMVTDAVSLVAQTGLALTDIAFAPDGRLFAITRDTLYRVDLRIGAVARIGALRSDQDLYSGVSALTDANGFDISPMGDARVSSGDNYVVAFVDLRTGRIWNDFLLIAALRHFSAGDLWYTDNAHYWVTTSIGWLDYIRLTQSKEGFRWEVAASDEGYSVSKRFDGLLAAPSGSVVTAPGTLIGFVEQEAYVLSGDYRSLIADIVYGTPLADFDLDGDITGATALRLGSAGP